MLLFASMLSSYVRGVVERALSATTCQGQDKVLISWQTCAASAAFASQISFVEPLLLPCPYPVPAAQKFASLHTHTQCFSRRLHLSHLKVAPVTLECLSGSQQKAVWRHFMNTSGHRSWSHTAVSGKPLHLEESVSAVLARFVEGAPRASSRCWSTAASRLLLIRISPHPQVSGHHFDQRDLHEQHMCCGR